MIEDAWYNVPKRTYEDRKTIEVGDLIEFGRYPQDVVDGKFLNINWDNSVCRD